VSLHTIYTVFLTQRKLLNLAGVTRKATWKESKIWLHNWYCLCTLISMMLQVGIRSTETANASQSLLNSMIGHLQQWYESIYIYARVWLAK
jgi:hypothetical protein